MCYLSDEIRELYSETVAELTDASKLFTAFDLTQLLRKMQVQNLPRHHDLKDLLHDMWRNRELPSDYIRTLMLVGGPVPAYVYHPSTVDPKDYQSAQHMPVATVHTVVPSVLNVPVSAPGVSQNVAPSKSASSVQKNTFIKDDIGLADKRGRLHVPAKYLKALGVGHYDPVYANVDSFCVTIAKQHTGSDDRMLFVDCYNNVKVCFGKNKAGKKFEFKANATHIVAYQL